jgi:glycosyltransferase involved in cell wall biosynthesis
MYDSEKMNVFIEATPLTVGRVSGIGHTLASLVRALSEDQEFLTEHSVVLFVPKGLASSLEHWSFKNVTLRELPYKKKTLNIKNYSKTLADIDKKLGIGTYIFGNFTNYPVSKESTSLTFVYDVCFERHPNTVRPKVRAILHTFLPGWIKRTNHVLTISEFSKTELTHFFKIAESKISVIPCGVDHATFKQLPDIAVSIVRKKYGLPERYILFVGNKEPRKNLERLVMAYLGVDTETRSGVPLVLIGGDGWLNGPINKAIAHARSMGCEIVEPKDYVEDEDLPAIFNGATFLAHPAIYEGFGISPLQAMTCGAPVLVANSSSIPEVVGAVGEYVDEKSVSDMTLKISKLLNDEKYRKALSKRGLERSKQFSWKNSAKLLTDKIEQLEV